MVIRRDGKLRLHVLSADGGELQTLAETVDVRGVPRGRLTAVDRRRRATTPAAGTVQNSSRRRRSHSPDRGSGTQSGVVAGRSLIVYAGPNVSARAAFCGAARWQPSRIAAISIRRDGERVRFMPDGKALIYMQGNLRAQDFWLLNLETNGDPSADAVEAARYDAYIRRHARR